MRKTVLLILTAMLVTACGTPERGIDAGDPQSRTQPEKYRAVGLVLEEGGAEPMLCLGTVNDSLPPQCGGLPIAEWDWDAISGEESAAGATWGTYEVVGNFDGRTFNLIEAGAPPDSPSGEGDSIEAACAEPSEGDPSLVSEADRLAAIKAAERSPSFAGAWIDYIDEPSEFTDPKDTILSLAFTGDLGGHEEEIREHWGGPLCVTEYEHPLTRLSEIQKELSGDAGRDLGLEVLFSDISVNRNLVEIGVVVIDADTREEIDERYGAGTVEVTAQLQPVP